MFVKGKYDENCKEDKVMVPKSFAENLQVSAGNKVDVWHVQLNNPLGDCYVVFKLKEVLVWKYEKSEPIELEHHWNGEISLLPSILQRIVKEFEKTRDGYVNIDERKIYLEVTGPMETRYKVEVEIVSIKTRYTNKILPFAFMPYATLTCENVNYSDVKIRDMKENLEEMRKEYYQSDAGRAETEKLGKQIDHAHNNLQEETNIQAKLLSDLGQAKVDIKPNYKLIMVMTEEGENSEIIVSVKPRFMGRNPPSGPIFDLDKERLQFEKDRPKTPPASINVKIEDKENIFRTPQNLPPKLDPERLVRKRYRRASEPSDGNSKRRRLLFLIQSDETIQDQKTNVVTEQEMAAEDTATV
uniref:Uncharacterized protein n=1 Tax=Acrobeloides nanus TaxID=290746 RepID=A0A914C3E2_9BILA